MKIGIYFVFVLFMKPYAQLQFFLLIFPAGPSTSKVFENPSRFQICQPTNWHLADVIGPERTLTVTVSPVQVPTRPGGPGRGRLQVRHRDGAVAVRDTLWSWEHLTLLTSLECVPVRDSEPRR